MIARHKIIKFYSNILKQCDSMITEINNNKRSNLPDMYVVNQVSSIIVPQTWMACLDNAPEYTVAMHAMLFPVMHGLSLVLLSHLYLQIKIKSSINKVDILILV